MTTRVSLIQNLLTTKELPASEGARLLNSKPILWANSLNGISTAPEDKSPPF